MAYDPKNARWSFETFRLGYEASSTYHPERPMGSWGMSTIENAALAALVGFSEQMRTHLLRAINWMDLAIAKNEDLGPNRAAYHAQLVEAKALARWLDSADPATAIWAETHDRHLGYLGEDLVGITGRWLAIHIDLLMAQAYQAERYAWAVAFFERMVGAKTFNLKRITSPRHVAYAKSLQALDQRFDPADVHAAGRRMLATYLDKHWLSQGQSVRAAIWLKIVHWQPGSSLSPVEVMLKAYDDMPHVTRPAFAIP